MAVWVGNPIVMLATWSRLKLRYRIRCLLPDTIKLFLSRLVLRPVVYVQSFSASLVVHIGVFWRLTISTLAPGWFLKVRIIGVMLVTSVRDSNFVAACSCTCIVYSCYSGLLPGNAFSRYRVMNSAM